MTSHRWQILKKQYKTHITKKGFLSPNQKKRIFIESKKGKALGIRYEVHVQNL